MHAHPYTFPKLNAPRDGTILIANFHGQMAAPRAVRCVCEFCMNSASELDAPDCLRMLCDSLRRIVVVRFIWFSDTRIAARVRDACFAAGANTSRLVCVVPLFARTRRRINTYHQFAHASHKRPAEFAYDSRFCRV